MSEPLPPHLREHIDLAVRDANATLAALRQVVGDQMEITEVTYVMKNGEGLTTALGKYKVSADE